MKRPPISLSENFAKVPGLGSAAKSGRGPIGTVTQSGHIDLSGIE